MRTEHRTSAEIAIRTRDERSPACFVARAVEQQNMIDFPSLRLRLVTAMRLLTRLAEAYSLSS
jgi:hypothetical protein